ncbi:MAG: RNA polymerase sigma factor [Planctomycetaceae bacterium]|nr:RNA polymerase sigma factor [Planctomycetaceae bacterium]
MANDEMDGHLPYLRRLALRLTGDQMAAEDAVQESIVRALRRDPSLAPVQNMQAWLCQIVTNVCRERWRKLGSALNASTDDPDQHIDARSPTAPEIVGQREHLEQVWAFVQTLPAMQRQVLLMCVVEGLSHEQIAQRLNTTTGSVKVSLSNARSRLRARFAEPNPTESNHEP